MLISGRTTPEASASLLLKAAHGAVAGDANAGYKAVRKAKPEQSGIKEFGTLLGAPYSTDHTDCTQKAVWTRERPRQEGDEDLPFPPL